MAPGMRRGASVLGSPHFWSLGFGSRPPEFSLGMRSGGEGGVRAGDWGCWGIVENHLSSPPREQAPGCTWPQGG